MLNLRLLLLCHGLFYFSCVLLITRRFEFINEDNVCFDLRLALLNSSVNHLLLVPKHFTSSVRHVALHHFDILLARWF